MSDHSAVPSALGYYFQGLYALILLLDSHDDDAKVSVETLDDVFLEGEIRSLHQLKHSLGNPGKLTVAYDGLWKTIRIWCSIMNSTDFDENTFFFFVTVHSVGDNSLRQLTEKNGSRDQVLEALEEEATRVCFKRDIVRKENEKAKKEQRAEKKMPYEVKGPGCEAFLKLDPEERRRLVDRIVIASSSFNIRNVPEQVTKRLKLVDIQIRSKVSERLIEWWDRRVVTALINTEEKYKKISRTELTRFIREMIMEIGDGYLTDDFSKKRPTSYEDELGGNMEKQIDLVKGGASWKKIASISRWRARNQREKWISHDLMSLFELDEYDEQLIEVWESYHEPVKEFMEDESDEAILENKGFEILEWSHHKAHSEVSPIKEEWRHPFLVQGSYQQLAEELRVGWHPNYVEILGNKGEE